MDGGHTKADASGWSVDTLHSHIQRMLNDRDAMWMELRKSDRELVVQRFEATTTAVSVALKENERRLQELNNLRQEVTQDRSELLKREVFEITVREWTIWRDALLKDISSWRSLTDQRLTTIETRSVTWTAALGIFFILVQIVMFWISRK